VNFVSLIKVLTVNLNLLVLKVFFFNFSIKNNFAKEKSNENVIAGVSKTPSQEINDVVDEI
jgi:hypothetical protein